jgi:hypothetical protein
MSGNSAEADANGPLILHVAPGGSDASEGLSAEAPLASPGGARDRLRRLRAEGRIPRSGARVLFHEGAYPITEPLTLGVEDSGTSEGPIVYAAAPGSHPLITGGRRLPALRPAGNGVWTADLPEAANHAWPFRQLFIDGRRYTLARSPNSGYFYVAGAARDFVDPTTGQKTPGKIIHDFRFPQDSLREWDGIEDVNIVVFHLWETSTLPLKSLDMPSRWCMLWGSGVCPAPHRTRKR